MNSWLPQSGGNGGKKHVINHTCCPIPPFWASKPQKGFLILFTIILYIILLYIIIYYIYIWSWKKKRVDRRHHLGIPSNHISSRPISAAKKMVHGVESSIPCHGNPYNGYLNHDESLWFPNRLMPIPFYQNISRILTKSHMDPYGPFDKIDRIPYMAMARSTIFNR